VFKLKRHHEDEHHGQEFSAARKRKREVGCHGRAGCA
jgi:hypothetical protein